MFNFIKNLIIPKSFGLDISEGSVKVAQLPNKFGQAPFSQGVKSIKLAMKRAGIKSKYVIASLPEEHSFTRLITRDGSIKKKIEENVPLPLDKIYYDWQDSKEGLFISAATKTIIDEYTALFKKAGLIIKALEPESIAITRALVKDNGNSMIIDIGTTKIDFIIVSKKIIRFTASKKKSVDLIKEAKKYLKYYRISKILICGNNSLIKEIIKKLREQLKIKIQLGKPWNKPLKCKSPMAYITAIGLALRQ